jgi:hypothetical protein
LKAKLFTLVLIALLLAVSMVSVADALVPKKAVATGVGVFVHEHDGVPHTHYFVFSVAGNQRSAVGSFRLVCEHDDQMDTTIISIRITSFTVQAVQDGWRADFSGTAWVKMADMPWQSGWTFQVTAFDLDSGSSDAIGVTLLNPQGQVQCSAEPTPLTSGNIIIRN